MIAGPVRCLRYSLSLSALVVIPLSSMRRSILCMNAWGSSPGLPENCRVPPLSLLRCRCSCASVIPVPPPVPPPVPAPPPEPDPPGVPPPRPAIGFLGGTGGLIMGFGFGSSSDGEDSDGGVGCRLRCVMGVPAVGVCNTGVLVSGGGSFPVGSVASVSGFGGGSVTIGLGEGLLSESAGDAVSETDFFSCCSWESLIWSFSTFSDSSSSSSRGS